MVSDQRPTKDERDRARQTIRAAFATGRIVEADHEQRLAAVDNAQTSTELSLIVQGLEPEVPDSWRGYQPAPAVSTTSHSAGAEPEASPPSPVSVPYGSTSGGSDIPFTYTPGSQTTVSGSWKIGVIVAVVFLVIVAGAGVAIFSAVDGAIDDAFDSAGPGAGETLAPGEMHEDGALDDLVAALREQNGSSMVFEAVFYPDYAVVTAAVQEGTDRSQHFYWNGELQGQTKSTNTYQPFDLSEIDDSVFDELCDKARKQLAEDVKTCYIVARRPGPSDEGAWLWVYGSNEYGEGGYFTATRDGKEVNRYVS